MKKMVIILNPVFVLVEILIFAKELVTSEKGFVTSINVHHHNTNSRL